MNAWVARSGYHGYVDEGLYIVVHTKADAMDEVRRHFNWEPPRGLITQVRRNGFWSDGREYVDLYKIDAVPCAGCGDGLCDPSVSQLVCTKCGANLCSDCMWINDGLCANCKREVR